MSAAYEVIRSETVPDLPGSLFLEPGFVAYQRQAQGKQITTFTATSPDGRSDVSLTLAGRDGVWSSPITGAFGGVVAIGRPPAASVFAVVHSATQWLRSVPAATGVVRLAPDAFADPTAAMLENALFRNGWRLDQTDLNYHLPITSSETFVADLGETKQKEIRRLKRSGAVFRRLEVETAEPAYKAIAENRADRGYPMTMSWPQLEALAKAFRGSVAFYTVERGGDVLAGAICLRLTATYFYVFYWGEAPAYRRESPVAFLAEGLMAELHLKGGEVLDLGISTEHSVPNPGLIAFKESLRCRTSGKRTYRLDPA
jgi:CelD/BcsL family acetyltransferase involved in cellulose biosynthesis